MDLKTLYKLRKLAITGGLIINACLLSGCGYKDQIEIEDQLEEEQLEKHEHLLIEMGDTQLIIRECDEEIGKIKITYGNGHFLFTVENTEGETILNENFYGNAVISTIETDLEEEAAFNLEEQLIENGAVIYKRY